MTSYCQIKTKCYDKIIEQHQIKNGYNNFIYGDRDGDNLYICAGNELHPYFFVSWYSKYDDDERLCEVCKKVYTIIEKKLFAPLHDAEMVQQKPCYEIRWERLKEKEKKIFGDLLLGKNEKQKSEIERKWKILNNV